MNTLAMNYQKFTLFSFALLLTATAAFANNPKGPDEEICSDVIELSIKHDDNAEEISWVLVNSEKSINVADGEFFTQEDDFQTIETAVCLPEGCYELTVYDSWGDGISSHNNEAVIEIKSQSGVSLIQSDGEFSDFITVEFCVDSNGTSITQPRS